MELRPVPVARVLEQRRLGQEQLEMRSDQANKLQANQVAVSRAELEPQVAGLRVQVQVDLKVPWREHKQDYKLEQDQQVLARIPLETSEVAGDRTLV